MLAFLHALTNDRSRAQLLLRELEAVAEARYVPPYNFGLIFYGLGDNQTAFDWLERAFEGRDVLLSAFINSEPIWDRLRNDERFGDLLRRMNLND